MGTVVVGVDGSGGSTAALKWAVDESRRRKAHLRIVGVWQPPIYAFPGFEAAGADHDHLQALAEERLSTYAEDMMAGCGADWDLVVREGQAAWVLLDEARDSDLLVVGSRGLGGVRSALLGSVSTQLAHHAPCPVVIIRPDHRETGESGETGQG